MAEQSKAYKNKQLKKRHKIKDNEHTSPIIQLVSGAIKASLLSFFCAFLFIFLLTLVAFKTQDPCQFEFPIALISLLLSSSLCGFLSGKFCPYAPIWCAVIPATLFSGTNMIISFFISASKNSPTSTLKILAILSSLIFVFIGMMLSHIKGSKRHRRKKLHH